MRYQTSLTPAPPVSTRDFIECGINLNAFTEKERGQGDRKRTHIPFTAPSSLVSATATLRMC